MRSGVTSSNKRDCTRGGRGSGHRGAREAAGQMPNPLCAFVGQGAALTGRPGPRRRRTPTAADHSGGSARAGARRCGRRGRRRRCAPCPRKGGRRRATPTSCSRLRPSAHEEGEAREGRAARRAAPGVGRRAEGEEAEGRGGADGGAGGAAGAARGRGHHGVAGRRPDAEAERHRGGAASTHRGAGGVGGADARAASISGLARTGTHTGTTF